MAIECLKYKAINKGSLQGIADLRCVKAGFDLIGCALHMKDGRSWINLPQREFVDRETNEKKYMNTVKIPDQEHYKAFQRMAKDAIDQWIKENEPQETKYHHTEIKPDTLPF